MKRGFSIGTILLAMVALTLLMFAVVSSSLAHFNLVRANGQRSHAKNLAESALSAAIDRLITEDYQLGLNGTDRVEVRFPGLDNAEGIVSFEAAGAFRDRWSTNNLGQEPAVAGAGGRSVPGRTLHLIARGRAGSTEVWMECLYYRPPFPDGLLATGPVEANALRLAGVRRDGAYAGGLIDSIDPVEEIPANLYSNSSDGLNPGDPSIEVANNSWITGSVRSRGQIQVDAGSTILGELLPGQRARTVPNLDLPAKIANLRPNALPLNPSYGTDLTLDENWFSHSGSGLSVQGDLHLNGSALLVEGDLVVRGSVLGTGVVLVDGAVTIEDGSSSVTSGDQIAVACTGDLLLTAAGIDSNYFKGLVYSEGNFTARDISIVGAAVVHGRRGRRGSATLQNVRFVRSPGGVEIALLRTRTFVQGQHYLAVSLTLRPGDLEGEYLCDVRAYRSLEGDIGNDPANLDNPLVWPRTDGFSEGYWPDLPVQNGGQNIGQVVGQWMEDLESTSRDDGDWVAFMSQRIPENIQAMLRENDGTYVVTFNLNNVLGELDQDSRVLLWRPYESP